MSHGCGGEIYPNDTGVLLKAGQNARLSYDLHSIGEEVKADFELGICSIQRVSCRSTCAGRSSSRSTRPRSIWPRRNHSRDGYERLNKAAVLTAFQPHMHIRGKHWVGDGGRTIDEMAFAWIGWYDLTEEEYKEKLAERKAQQQQQRWKTGN